MEIFSHAGTLRMGSARRDGTAPFDCVQAIFGPLNLRNASKESFNFKSQFLDFLQKIFSYALLLTYSQMFNHSKTLFAQNKLMILSAFSSLKISLII